MISDESNGILVRSDPEWNPNSISRTSHDIDRRPSKGITF